jgi:hypothetical protein
MSQKEKLLDYLCSLPKDFTIAQLKKLMKSLGYTEYTKGKTSGSRIAFYHQRSKLILNLHKPHPGNELKIYQIKEVIKFLKIAGDIK